MAVFCQSKKIWLIFSKNFLQKSKIFGRFLVFLAVFLAESFYVPAKKISKN